MREADLCYGCGKRYRTRLGTFSPVWKCHECGAPLCVVCWETGQRECADHTGIPSEENAPHQEPRAPVAGLALDPAETGDPQRQHSRPGTATPYSVAADAINIDYGAHLGEIFLSGFDRNVRSLGTITLPYTMESVRLDPKAQAQTPQRRFGEVRQFVFSSRLPKRNRLCLAAIALKGPGLSGGEGTLRPAGDLFEQIAGPMGLNFEDAAFCFVGIFSPVGWPESWKTHDPVRGDVDFCLVEHLEGTAWEVFGPEGPWKTLFNPETASEQQKRTAKAFAAASELMLPGGLILLDEFLQEYHLSREAVQKAVGSSDGRYLILEHKGKFAVQRAAR